MKPKYRLIVLILLIFLSCVIPHAVSDGSYTAQVMKWKYTSISTDLGNGCNGSKTVTSNEIWGSYGTITYRNYTDLMINSGVTVTIRGAVVIRVQRYFNNSGTLSAVSGGADRGLGGNGGLASDGSPGANGENGGFHSSSTGNGGSGGAAAPNSGGASGSGGGANAHLDNWLDYIGGGGGGGGGGASAHPNYYGGNGGQGGRGGGVVVIYCRYYKNSGIIAVDGGVGWDGGDANPTWASGGGGGGGGSAGLARVRYHVLVSSGTVTANGGSKGLGGNGFGPGNDGSVGSAGTVDVAQDANLLGSTSSATTSTTYSYYYNKSQVTLFRYDFDYSFPILSVDRQINCTYPKTQSIENLTAVGSGGLVSSSLYSIYDYNSTHKVIVLLYSCVLAHGNSFKLFTFTSTVPIQKVLYSYAHNTARESFATSDDSSQAFWGINWEAQTWTTGASVYTIGIVSLKLLRVGNPGTVTVSIRAVSGGLPTGSDLTSGTIDGNTFTTDTAGQWYNITLTSYSLSASTAYAIVVRVTSATSSNYIKWRYDNGNGYSGGTRCYSTNSGSSWTSTSTNDYMFKTYSLDTTSGSTFTSEFFHKEVLNANGTWGWKFTYSFPAGNAYRWLNCTFLNSHSIVNVTELAGGTALNGGQYSIYTYNSTHKAVAISEATIASKGYEYKVFTTATNYVNSISVVNTYNNPSGAVSFKLRLKDPFGNGISWTAWMGIYSGATELYHISGTSDSSGWWNATITAPGSDGSYFLRANTTGGLKNVSFKVSRIEIGLSANDTRVDLNIVVLISGTAKYCVDNTNIDSGTAYINGTSVSISSGAFSKTYSYGTIGFRNFNLTSVSDGGAVTALKEKKSIDVAWDKVSITALMTDTRIGIGETANFTAIGEYLCDAEPWSGSFTLNDTATKSAIGKYGYKVVSITDSNYGLTGFETSTSTYVIFDKWSLGLYPVDNRINVGATAQIATSGSSIYDGYAWSGSFTLNDSETKNSLGKYGYKITSIANCPFGVTVFTTGSTYVIFDRVNVNGLKFLGFNSNRSARFQIDNLTRAYDASLIFDGYLKVNGTQYSVGIFSVPINNSLGISVNGYDNTYLIDSESKPAKWNTYFAAYPVTTEENRTCTVIWSQTSKVLQVVTVNGHVHIKSPQPYMVAIDGDAKSPGDGWSYDSGIGVITATLPSSTLTVYYQAQTGGTEGSSGSSSGGPIYPPQLTPTLNAAFLGERKAITANILWLILEYKINNTAQNPIGAAFLRVVLPEAYTVTMVKEGEKRLIWNTTDKPDTIRAQVFNVTYPDPRKVEVWIDYTASVGRPELSPATFMGVTMTVIQWAALALAIFGAIAIAFINPGWALIVGALTYLVIPFARGADPRLVILPTDWAAWIDMPGIFNLPVKYSLIVFALFLALMIYVAVRIFGGEND